MIVYTHFFYVLIIICGLFYYYQNYYQNYYRNEIKYKELFEHINSGVIIYEVRNNGEEFIIKDINTAGQKIDDVKKEEVLGKNIEKAYPGVNNFGVLEALKKVWKKGFKKPLFKKKKIRFSA